MESNKKKFNWTAAVIIVMICLLIIFLIKINRLSNEMSDLQSTLSEYQNQVSALRNEISSIYANVDKKLKKELW